MYKVVITRMDGVQMVFKARNFQAACSLIAGVTAATEDPFVDWSISPLKEEENEKEKK